MIFFIAHFHGNFRKLKGHNIILWQFVYGKNDATAIFGSQILRPRDILGNSCAKMGMAGEKWWMDVDGDQMEDWWTQPEKWRLLVICVFS